MLDPIVAQNKLIKLRQKLASKQPSIGSWVQIPSPITTELLAGSGYDWIAVDLEHGAINMSDTNHLIRSIEVSSSIPLVRLPDHSVSTARRCMDAGFYGVIIPNICSKKQLHEISSNLSYPPTGVRGVGFCSANQFGRQFESYKQLSETPFIVPMIESSEGVNNIQDILSLGPDAVLVGPYDLSSSLDIVGEFHHSKFQSAIQHIFDSCKATNIPFGMHQVNPCVDQLKNFIDLGYLFIPYSIDSVFFTSSITNPYSS